MSKVCLQLTKLFTFSSPTFHKEVSHEVIKCPQVHSQLALPTHNFGVPWEGFTKNAERLNTDYWASLSFAPSTTKAESSTASQMSLEFLKPVLWTAEVS